MVAMILFVTSLVLLSGWYWLMLRWNKTEDKRQTAASLFAKPTQRENDYRRFKTYLPPVPNTWYHLADSDEVKAGASPLYIRALGQNFAVWRTTSGTPVVMDAYCPHMGANIAVGGKIIDDCIQCPFHEWKFDKDGKVVDIPYLNDKDKCKNRLPTQSIKKYPCTDWCGLLCVYFHADFEEVNETPEFALPQFVQDEIDDRTGGNHWHRTVRHDIGHVELSCIDWVDQSGDHGHFKTLHTHFLIPYTQMPIPQWICRNVSIQHQCQTILGDKWDTEKHGDYPSPYYGSVACKQLIYFLDNVGIAWKNEIIESTRALTRELYVGPGIMVFHIPLGDKGDLKIFVTTTPAINKDGISGGSVMRVRVWLSNKSLILRLISWFVVGTSLSQMLADIEIMENKIRLKKPLITKDCGPWNTVNSWLKQFYSKSSEKVGTHSLDLNDW